MSSGQTCKECRLSQVKRVLLIVLLLNLAVALAKYCFGTYMESAAMRADGIHSFFDSVGNVVGLLGITIAARPADRRHPYGHDKFETYASLFIGVLLLLAAYEVGSSALHDLMARDSVTDVTVLSYVVMLATMAVNITVTTYERRQARKLGSEILSADAAHTLSDVLVSLGVIVGFVFVQLGFPLADPIMALVVMVVILVSAFNVFRSAFATLSDAARIPADELSDLVCAIDGVRSVHRIRSRGTSQEVYLDLHMMVDPDMTVQQAHDLCDAIEEAVRRRWPAIADVTIHVEPYSTDHRDEPGPSPSR